jgi:acetyltransferase
MLESLLSPQTIAVLGASRTPGKVGHEVVANLINGGYQGTIVPVNPKADEILGLKCYHDLKEYDGKVDLGVVVVPQKGVKASIQNAIDAGAKAVIVITAGFKEVGPEGAALEKEIAQLCRSNNVRLMGPNCIGLINMHHKMNATFASSVPPPGGISVISQSGALCVAILDWAVSKKMGFSKVVSFGNKADLNEVDFLQALAEDKDTKVVAGYLESITEGDEFLRVAEQVASVKPVVILKVGITQAGAKAAASHTGSLAGTDIAYGAAFKRAGVIRAEHLESLFDYALAFAMQPLPVGDRVTVITNAGGPGIMAADAAETMGLKLPAPTEATRKKLCAFLPSAAAVGNPIDVVGDAAPDRYVKAFEVLQDDENTDAIIVVVTPQNMTRPLELAKRLAASHNGKKPVLAAFLGGEQIEAANEQLMALGIPSYPAPDRAVAALKAMQDYSAWRNRPPRVVPYFPVNRRRVERVINWHARLGQNQIGEVEAKEILRAYDFNILPGQLVTTVDEAVETAGRIGYPIVLKIVSPDVIHKSDFGGVRINLGSAEQVRDAFDLTMLRVRQRAPNALIRGVYVEKMGPKGREVILGMTRDPQFGPMLMFGLGGIFVEVMKDVTFYLAPITAEEAMQMLKSTRSYALLEGARGQAPVDLDVLATGLQHISQLATDYPQIKELDINPFIVGGVGTPAYVADARMTLATIGAQHE